MHQRVSYWPAMRFWRPLAWSPVDVVCGQGTLAGVVAHHAHEALQVFVPMSPFAAVGDFGRTAIVSPGLAHVTLPLDLFAGRCVQDEPLDACVLLIGPALFALASSGLREDISLQTGLIADAAAGRELLAVFEELRHPCVGPEVASRLVACVRGLLCLSYCRSAMADHNVPLGVVRARDYLREHTVTPVALDDVARAAFLSKFYLLRAFHRAYGLTPHEYQAQLRLARARRLLADGHPLSDAAYEAGFADQSHLTRRFAAYYGLTPARFVRQLARPLSDFSRENHAWNCPDVAGGGKMTNGTVSASGH